jgi:hypothetical protein
MSRGRPKLEENIEKPRVYKRVFKGDDCDTTWFYDENVTKNGPVRVDIKWHKTYKQLQQEGRQERAKEREKIKINKFFKEKETQPKTRKKKIKK